MLSPDTSAAASSPRTVYGSDNEPGFPGMEVFLADQTPECVPAERLPGLSQPERSPKNEMKPWLNFNRKKNFFKNGAKNDNGVNNNDSKRSRNRRLCLLIIILLGVAIIITLAIALPLSLRHRGRESR